MSDHAATVPDGWTAQRAPSDWWVLYTLTHDECGWTTEPLTIPSPEAEVETWAHMCGTVRRG